VNVSGGTFTTSTAQKQAIIDGASIEGTAIKSTGESGGTKFLREDGDGTCSFQTVSAGSVEGTAILSTGETGTSKYLRIDGDNSSSWQPVSVSASDVGLGNVTNESKATMFTSPTFTGNVALGSNATGTFEGAIGTSATFVGSLINKGTDGYVILPSGLEIKWGYTASQSSFADGDSMTHTYTTAQGGSFASATLWGIGWLADRTTGPMLTGGSGGTIGVNSNAGSIELHGGTGSTASNVRLGFLAIGH